MDHAACEVEHGVRRPQKGIAKQRKLRAPHHPQITMRRQRRHRPNHLAVRNLDRDPIEFEINGSRLVDKTAVHNGKPAVVSARRSKAVRNLIHQ